MGCALKGVLSELFTDQELIYLVDLAVTEAVSNSIRHAYGGETGYLIKVKLQINEKDLVVTVQDQGQKMDPGFLDKKGFSTCRDVKEVKEGGRGIPLINEIMDHVEYSSLDGINHLIMKKEFDRGK